MYPFLPAFRQIGKFFQNVCRQALTQWNVAKLKLSADLAGVPVDAIRDQQKTVLLWLILRKELSDLLDGFSTVLDIAWQPVNLDLKFIARQQRHND